MLAAEMAPGTSVAVVMGADMFAGVAWVAGSRSEAVLAVVGGAAGLSFLSSEKGQRLRAAASKTQRSLFGSWREDNDKDSYRNALGP